MSSAAPVAFYFEFSSPYGYIASQVADDLEQRIGRALDWRPILLGPVFKVTGTSPLTQVPLKGEYSKRDFDRSARQLKVPYRHPDNFPIGTVAACRAFYWLKDRDPAAARKLAGALYRAYFVDNRDIGTPVTVLAVAKEAGLDAAALESAIGELPVKERVKREVDAAIAAGVFGSPFFIVDGEPFWGVDRIPMLEAWVRSGGW
jgi:2-hydroxychromene-2-carboxylate isomerase